MTVGSQSPSCTDHPPTSKHAVRSPSMPKMVSSDEGCDQSPNPAPPTSMFRPTPVGGARSSLRAIEGTMPAPSVVAIIVHSSRSSHHDFTTAPHSYRSGNGSAGGFSGVPPAPPLRNTARVTHVVVSGSRAISRMYHAAAASVKTRPHCTAGRGEPPARLQQSGHINSRTR